MTQEPDATAPFEEADAVALAEKLTSFEADLSPGESAAFQMCVAQLRAGEGSSADTQGYGIGTAATMLVWSLEGLVKKDINGDGRIGGSYKDI